MTTQRLNPARTSRLAFSLVEVLCAVSLLGVAVVGLTQGITTALSSSKESEQHSTAALIAAGQIETLRADGFIIDGESEGESDVSGYRWKQSVTTTALDGLYDVEVTVEQAGSGRTLYSLRTLLFDPPFAASSTTNAPGQKRPGQRPDRKGAP